MTHLQLHQNTKLGVFGTGSSSIDDAGAPRQSDALLRDTLGLRSSVAPPSPTLLRAVNTTLALIHAESIRKTDDLARAHGAQLLEYAELAFIGRVMGAAQLGRKISGDDFDELRRLSTRAVNSDYVAFDGTEQMRALLRLIAETDLINKAASAAKAVEAEPSAPGIAASGPVPELPPIRHRARPMTPEATRPPDPLDAC